MVSAVASFHTVPYTPKRPLQEHLRLLALVLIRHARARSLWTLPILSSPLPLFLRMLFVRYSLLHFGQ